MNESEGTLEDFLMNITQHDSKIGSVTFRQRWIHKHDNLPKRYKDVKQVKLSIKTKFKAMIYIGKGMDAHATVSQHYYGNSTR